MSNEKIAPVPKNLITLAKKTPFINVGIVCAHQKFTMESAKLAYESSLINPIFIGKKHSIQQEAELLQWNINKFEIIEKENEDEAAKAGAQLAKENKMPWELSFSYGRGLQSSTLKKWEGKDTNLIEAQKEFISRCEQVSLAREGLA